MHRILYLVLIVYGAFSQITQALLIREDLVVFYGNEVSLGAFFGSWLLWVAVGSVLAIPLRARLTNPIAWLRTTLIFLPFILLLQIVITRFSRYFFDISATQFIPLGDLFLAVTLINLPSALTLGLAFPLACHALYVLSRRDPVGGISSLYIFDALGALAGGFAFTFILIEWAGVWSSWGIILIVMAVTGMLLGKLEPVKSGVGFRSRNIFAGATLLFALLYLFSPLQDYFSRYMEEARFATLQPGMTLLDSTETRYGHVAIAKLGQQTSIVKDGRIGASFPVTEEIEKQAAYYTAQANIPRRILLFGGLAGGLPAELLRYPVERVTVVEQDRLAFEKLRPYLMTSTREALRDPRMEIVFEDGRRFTNRQSVVDYDLVLVVSHDPSSAHENRYFTADFYTSLNDMMSDAGVICTEVSSASNYLGSTVRSYSGSLLATLNHAFDHVAIMPGDVHTYCASNQSGQVTEDPSLLEHRYLATPLATHRFPAASFYSMLPQDRIAFVRQQLQHESAEINTDARPVTYYYNMLLWGKFSSSRFVEWLEKLRQMGAWPYVIPLLVLVLLSLLRFSLQPVDTGRFQRQSASLILVVLGMIAMAAQLTLLYSYQAHVGFVFSRIALLNSLFMAGLALGAGVIGQRLARLDRTAYALIAVMLVTTIFLDLLPPVYHALGYLALEHQEFVYLTLTLLIGLLTGAGFPLGVQLAQADTGNVMRSSGITAAADNLGGSAGGFLTGALLVPILGVDMTCYTLALMAFLSLLPLLYASTPLVHFDKLRVRGYQAFPYPTLSWLLLWIVGSVFLIKLLMPAEIREPTLKFDQTTLNAVSQSKNFTLNTKPVPHYLGYVSDQNDTNPETVSLASMAVTRDIRGYGGPINLLVSINHKGTLQGVKHIASRETPSYIEDIDSWLKSLKGISLKQRPLSLDDIDGLSGATTTSRAALATISRAASEVSEMAFGKALFTQTTVTIDWIQPRVLMLLTLLALFFPVWKSGRDNWRLAYQGLVLVVLGFWFNMLVTEVDLVNLSEGRIPSPYASLPHFLLISFTLVITLLLGQVYCGYICPFGALQEFISRIGRHLYLRSYPDQELERRMRYVKFILLACLLLGYWLTRNKNWIYFNPMQHFFAFQLEGWILLITAISLIGALFYYRFWCRYFCPFGAFLAIGNKIALFKHSGPQRDFHHCDLGVDNEYDIDCLHCNRCIDARDYGLRKRKTTRPRA